MSEPVMSEMGLLLPMIVFLVTFVLELVSFSFKNGMANKFYCTLLGNQSEIEALDSDLAQLKQHLTTLSPQDEFALWAKTQRSFNKKSAELQALTEIRDKRVAVFHRKVWVITLALQTLLLVLFRGTPMFFLPANWFQPFSFVLALPFSPAGSVGIAFWMIVSRGVCASLFSSVLA